MLKIGDLVIINYKASGRIGEITRTDNYSAPHKGYYVTTLYDWEQDAVTKRHSVWYGEDWLTKITPELVKKKLAFWSKLGEEI